MSERSVTIWNLLVLFTIISLVASSFSVFPMNKKYNRVKKRSTDLQFGTDKELETIKMALNDSISDMDTELKQELSPEKKNELTNFKARYTRVFDKLKQSGSIYALTETDLDVVAGGLNDAMELIEEHMTDDLSDEDVEEILGYKNDCQMLVDLLSL